MNLPNKFFLRACLWDIEHDTYASVEYPPAPRTFSVWSHDDPAIHAEFVAHFEAQIATEGAS